MFMRCYILRERWHEAVGRSDANAWLFLHTFMMVMMMMMMMTEVRRNN